MPPNCHPCIKVSKHETLGGLSPPRGGKDKHQKGNNKKNAMLQHCKEQILVKIKGYVKFVERQLKVLMGYDGKNEDAVNPNGKHQ
jgi:hypothetical protein